MLPGAIAQADPDVSDDDVRAAQEAVRTGAGVVAAIELELAQQSAALDAAWVAVATAAEDYTGAVVAQDAAQAAAADAAERSARADEQAEEARAELGQIALEASRSGGSLDGVAVLLSADGYEDFVARSTAIDQIGRRTERAVQRYQAAELVGRTLAELAQEAADQARQAASSAEQALRQAEQLQAAAEAEVARVAAEREVLLAQLAELRQTSLEVERAHQAALDAERAARSDAAARAAHPTQPPPGGGTGTPADPPPTTPPASTPPAGDPPATTPPASTPPATTPPATTPPPSTPPPSTPPSADPYGLGTGSQRGSADQGLAAVAWAQQQVGKPYVYGASGPDSFDCSGLTMRAWAAAGVAINRSSRDQYRQVYKITYDSMRPGDLIFYGTVASDPGSVYHVAMYIGNGQVVEAPRPGIPVRIAAVRWTSTMPFAGRP